MLGEGLGLTGISPGLDDCNWRKCVGGGYNDRHVVRTYLGGHVKACGHTAGSWEVRKKSLNLLNQEGGRSWGCCWFCFVLFCFFVIFQHWRSNLWPSSCEATTLPVSYRSAPGRFVLFCSVLFCSVLHGVLL